MIIFSFDDQKQIEAELIKTLGYKKGEFSPKRYPTDEIYIEIKTDVSGKECLVIGNTSSPTKNLIEYYLLCHTLKKDGAKKVIGLMTNLGYSRHDKNTKGLSMAANWVGQIAKISGLDEIVAVDIHSEEDFQLFKVPLKNIFPAKLFADEIKKLELSEFTLMSPDENAVNRCKLVADKLAEMGLAAPKIAHTRKVRTPDDVIDLGIIGKEYIKENIVIIDDELGTGETLVECCKCLSDLKTKRVYIFVTHGRFATKTWEELWNLNVKNIWCTDTLTLPQKAKEDPRIKTLPITPEIVDFFKSQEG